MWGVLSVIHFWRKVADKLQFVVVLARKLILNESKPHRDKRRTTDEREFTLKNTDTRKESLRVSLCLSVFFSDSLNVVYKPKFAEYIKRRG